MTSVPDMFPGPLGHSLIGRALKENIWSLEVVDLRNYAYDTRGSIDDKPYGGGPGMIIRPDVIEKGVKKSIESIENETPLVYMTPGGKPLTQKKIRKYAEGPGLIILCGRYEGVDERVLDAYNFEKVSIGDYVISGGEVAAMVLIEGCIRLLPEVIGKKESLKDESFNDGLIEYPQYTRPQLWKDLKDKEHSIPEILLSGDHKRIEDWRKEQSITNTKKIRPDLIKNKN
ncbi:MAG: tRNA (guanine-N(1)-)-methyltransferase [Alphaproteobacteria bacterium MarineAlpha5_Bin11]|nr:MAG: tRNA (guanine-N(1)-)-methyltransferase [Alphaproteobacteria bacterium MarineAlpha5_Bin11]